MQCRACYICKPSSLIQNLSFVEYLASSYKNATLTESQNHRTGGVFKSHQVQSFIAIESTSQILNILKSICSEIKNFLVSTQCPYSCVLYKYENLKVDDVN